MLARICKQISANFTTTEDYMVYDNLSALNAFSNGMAVSAHNIANINTSNFTSWEYHYGAGPGSTVQLQINPSSIRTDNADALNPLPPTFTESQNLGLVNNNVDLAREFTGQITTEHAFAANAVAIRTQEEMSDSLYNQVYGPGIVSYRV